MNKLNINCPLPKKHYRTTYIILENIENKASMKRNLNYIPDKWSKGMFSKISNFLTMGIPPKEIFDFLYQKINDESIFDGIKKLKRPNSIFKDFKSSFHLLILIDKNGNELDKEKWGYFKKEEFIPPDNKNSLFYKLKEEEICRITSNNKNTKFDEYFRDDGFLKDEYSFISGIFNEKNIKWRKK